MKYTLRHALGLVASLVVAALILSLVNTIVPTRTHAQLGGIQTWAGTSTGTANAPVISIHNVLVLNDLLGVPIRYIPNITNTGPTTLTINLDSGGTLSATVQRPTANLGLQGVAGTELQAGQMVEVVYDGSVFEIKSSINMTPIGQSVEVRGTIAPLGTFIEDGTCYSQTTYVSLFTVLGTAYNAQAPVACGGGQFAVPDSRGSFFAATDTQGSQGAASRITNAGSGCTATAVGTRCGLQNQTLTQAQLPVIAGVGIINGNSNTAGGSQSSFTGTTIGGGTAHPILNPVLLGIRAIKY